MKSLKLAVKTKVKWCTDLSLLVQKILYFYLSKDIVRIILWYIAESSAPQLNVKRNDNLVKTWAN